MCVSSIFVVLSVDDLKSSKFATAFKTIDGKARIKSRDYRLLSFATNELTAATAG